MKTIKGKYLKRNKIDFTGTGHKKSGFTTSENSPFLEISSKIFHELVYLIFDAIQIQRLALHLVLLVQNLTKNFKHTQKSLKIA